MDCARGVCGFARLDAHRTARPAAELAEMARKTAAAGMAHRLRHGTGGGANEL